MFKVVPKSFSTMRMAVEGNFVSFLLDRIQLCGEDGEGVVDRIFHEEG